jgi:hypothetical protein
MNSTKTWGGLPPHIAVFKDSRFEIYKGANSSDLTPILRDHIRRMVDYLYDDEAEDYTYRDSDQGHHMFCSISAVKCWLDADSD